MSLLTVMCTDSCDGIKGANAKPALALRGLITLPPGPGIHRGTSHCCPDLEFHRYLRYALVVPGDLLFSMWLSCHRYSLLCQTVAESV